MLIPNSDTLILSVDGPDTSIIRESLLDSLNRRATAHI
jgi:hypothetical protein